MSDLQDLIHKTVMDCIQKGRTIERERIIKLLEEHLVKMGARATSHEQKLIELIKGETK